MSFAEDKVALQRQIDTLIAQATTYLTELKTTADVQFGNTPFNIDDIIPTKYDYSTVPTVDFPVFFASNPRPNVTVPTISAVPTFPTVPTTADVVVPDFTTAAPSVSFPTVPSSALPTAPGVAPSFTDPTIPTAPTVNLPSVPTFGALLLPAAPSVNMPAFTGVLPNDDLLTPTATFQFYEAAYQSTLLDPLKVKLLDNLLNGGYGIDTNDEVALFNRDRDREVEAAMTRIEEAGRAMASRGFPLPPGELSIHIDRAWQEMQDKVASGSREIMLERAKLFVENRQFTIREVKELEQVTLGFHNSVQERALNTAKATVELSIAIYNTLLSRFTARLEEYKAQGTVFAELIRGELVKAEIYRTEVEAVGVSAQIQRQQVEVYLAQLKGIEISVDIYKSKMEAARIQAEIERLKLEAFRSQVEAYTAQVQAKVAEFGMYRAQIDGEKAKVEVFDSQVRAYNGQVAAAKVKADVQIAKLQVVVEQSRAMLANYQAQVAQYDATIRAQLESGTLQIRGYEADIQSKRQEVDGLAARASLQQEVLKSTTQQNIQISNMTIENAKAKLEAAINALKFKTGAAQYASEKYFAQITALESTLNALTVYNPAV